MTKQNYTKLTGPFRRHPRLARWLHICNRTASALVVISYGGLLAWEFLYRAPLLTQTVIVPLNSFIVVSVFRWMVNRRRPYERFGVEPVIPREKTGKSFPSRHVFSAFVIAMTFLLQTPFVGYGIFLLCVGALIGAVRVLSGVHYPSDVLAGAAAGMICGLLGFRSEWFLLPFTD